VCKYSLGGGGGGEGGFKGCDHEKDNFFVLQFPVKFA